MNEEIKETNPLWLPAGSVRSIIVFGLLGLTGYMLIRGIAIPDWFIAIVSSAMAYYFTIRGEKK